MLILILGIAAVAFIAFLVLRVICPASYNGLPDAHTFFTFMAWTFGLVILGLIIAICWISTTVATESTLDSKIAMYQQENANIEEDIDRIVREYL